MRPFLKQIILVLSVATFGLYFVPLQAAVSPKSTIAGPQASPQLLEVENGLFLAKIAGQRYCLIGINDRSRTALTRLASQDRSFALGIADRYGIPGAASDLLHSPSLPGRLTSVVWGIRVNFSGCVTADLNHDSLPILAVTAIEPGVRLPGIARSMPAYPNHSPFHSAPEKQSHPAIAKPEQATVCLTEPTDNLLAVVTKTYKLHPEYAPQELVAVEGFLPQGTSLEAEIHVQAMVVEPLLKLVAAMLEAGLQPQLLSGYRSFNTQSYTYDAWARRQPERAPFISAQPGHSEHQLGTTVDFGSPHLAQITGSPSQRYHTDFYLTPERSWLLENAHHFGFMLSYPPGKAAITGYYFEPWHYRYVGSELATDLRESDTTLTEHLLKAGSPPCLG